MDAGPDPPARRPLPKKPRLDRPRISLLAWLHSTLEPKRRLRLPEGELSAFVTSIADRLLAGARDDGSSVTGRTLKEFFTRAGPEASRGRLPPQAPPHTRRSRVAPRRTPSAAGTSPSLHSARHLTELRLGVSAHSGWHGGVPGAALRLRLAGRLGLSHEVPI